MGCCGLASTLKRVDLIHIVDPLVNKPVLHSDTQYFRLHGLGRLLYSYTYTDVDLEELKRTVSGLKAPECYVLFNNVTARDDVIRFRRLLGKDGLKVI